MALAVLALAFLYGCSNEGDNAGECTDNLDNDGDGLYDCNDPGCFEYEECEEVEEIDWDSLEVGGVGGLISWDYINPETLVSEPEDQVWATARFFDSLEIAPDMDVLGGRTVPVAGTCVQIDEENYNTSWAGFGSDAGPTITLDGPTTLEIGRSEEGVGTGAYNYADMNLPPSGYSTGVYSLSISGGEDITAQTITAAITTMPLFTSTLQTVTHKA